MSHTSLEEICKSTTMVDLVIYSEVGQLFSDAGQLSRTCIMLVVRAGHMLLTFFQ